MKKEKIIQEFRLKNIRERRKMLLDLTRRTSSHKILRDKAFNIAKNPKYYGYQKGLDSMVYKFFW